jgi:hypothetical protein
VNDQDTENLTHTVGNDGIFLRASDRTRFDYVMRAVRESSASLALSSNSEGVLDHYGRLVLARLRKTEGLQIEVFLPQNTEQLLERFNQILSDISMDDARRAEGSPAPRRVLIAHDAKAINQRDLQLLARLVQDFPGANVSLVLLVDRAGMMLHERTLDSFGQRLLRWPVEPPTRTEGESLLKVARAMGFEVEVKKVLAATGYAELKIAPKPKKDKEKSTEPSTAQARFEAQLAAARKERKAMDEAEAERQQRTEPTLDGPSAPVKPAFTEPAQARGLLSKLLRWTAATVLMLAVSLVLVALLFAQNLSPLLANSPILKDNLPTWAMDQLVALVGKPPTAKLEEEKAAEAARTEAEATATAAAAVPTSTDDQPTVPAPAVDSASIRTDSAAVSTAEPAAKAEVRADSSTLAKADAASAEPAKPEATPEPKADTKAEPVKAADALAPRSERGVDQLVRQSKPGSFFVQHVSLGSMAEAQEWRAQFGVLTKARIVAVNTQDKGVKFAVVSGPFATRKEAESYAGRQGMPPNPWLRPVKSLQSALLPAGR